MPPSPSRSPVPEWPLRWTCDHARRIYTHRSGLVLALDPDSYPLAWRVILPDGLPPGYVLNVGMMRKMVQEATSMLQAQALGFIPPVSIKPGPNINMTPAELARHNDLKPSELTADMIEKLRRQWQAARETPP